MSDPIADMLTRIRNAGKAKHNSVDIPGSKIKTEIAKVLKESGYIRNYKFINDGQTGHPARPSQVHRCPGTHHHQHRTDQQAQPTDVSQRQIRGTGLQRIGDCRHVHVSGVMTDKAAREKNIGGEVLCTLW
jgi:small subunit ribosomal protein S8